MLKINGYEVKKTTDSSGETYFLPHLEGKKLLYFDFKFEGNASLMELYFTVKQLKDYDKILLIDYLPYMGKGNLIAKDMADFLKGLGFIKIFTLDPVSKFAELELPNLDISYCPMDWAEIVEEDKVDAICLYSKPEVDKYLDSLELSPFNVLTVGEYVNNPSLEMFKDKTVLVIDNKLDEYTTSKFLEMAKTLKEKGAKKVILYVTHCTSAVYKGNLLTEGSPIDKIYFSSEVGNVNALGQSQKVVQFEKEYDF